MNLPLENADCVGQDELCKVVTNNSEAPKTGFDEPKVSAGKKQSTNNSDSAINESHDESNHELFCVTGKDSDYIDIEDLY